MATSIGVHLLSLPRFLEEIKVLWGFFPLFFLCLFFLFWSQTWVSQDRWLSLVSGQNVAGQLLDQLDTSTHSRHSRGSFFRCKVLIVCGEITWTELIMDSVTVIYSSPLNIDGWFPLFVIHKIIPDNPHFSGHALRSPSFIITPTVQSKARSAGGSFVDERKTHPGLERDSVKMSSCILISCVTIAIVFT